MLCTVCSVYERVAKKKDYGLDEYLSPQFFYNNRNYWNNNIKDVDDLLEDYGMTGRDVMKILKL